MMKSFETVWNTLQAKLKPGTEVRNWTAHKGYLGDSMTIVDVGSRHISVDAPNARNIQRVPKTDFEKMWVVWDDYKTEKVKRYEIRDMTMFSKYIISILHWYDVER